MKICEDYCNYSVYIYVSNEHYLGALSSILEHLGASWSSILALIEHRLKQKLEHYEQFPVRFCEQCSPEPTVDINTGDGSNSNSNN